MPEIDADELRKLVALRDDGIISEKEFQRQKRRWLHPAPASLVRGPWWAGGAALVVIVAVLAFLLHPATPAQTTVHLDETGASVGQVQAAIAYAERYVGQDHDDGECLQFVWEAWSAAGIDIGGRYSSDTALAYWQANPKQWSEIHSPHVYNNPPAGALVFWGNNQYVSDGGHVGISVGDGTVVSTAAYPYANRNPKAPSPDVFHFPLTARPATTYNYLGYMMPLNAGSSSQPAAPPAAHPSPTPTLKVTTGGGVQPAAPGSIIQPAPGSGLQSTAPIPSVKPTSQPTPITTAPPTTATPAPSGPIFTVMNTDDPPPDGVWFRWAPYTADTNEITGDGVYANEQVQLKCYAVGQAVGPYNDTLWYFVQNITRPTIDGMDNEGYLNAHYINDGQLAGVVDAGVPAC